MAAQVSVSDDDELPSVASLDARRREAKREREGRAAHERGEAFEFEFLEDPAGMVGTTTVEVVVILDACRAEGFAMSTDAARAFGVALIGAAEMLDREMSDAMANPEADE